MALASIGTDTGGSIRIPAAACGTVGLKPTFGEISTEGVVPLSPSFDNAGPLAQTVGDAWIVYRAMAGDPDPRPVQPIPLAALRLAVLREYFCDVLDDEVRARFEESLERLRADGVRLHETTIAHAGGIAAAYVHVVLAEAAAYHGPSLDLMPERYTEPVRQRLETGRSILAQDYLRGLAARDELRREVDAALADCDALVLPTLAIPAPPIGTETIALGGTPQPLRSVMLRLTQLFNMTGHPAISLPSGRTANGLPCAMQMVGGRGHTATLVRAALTCEAALAKHTRMPT
jgi:aspartyl-tRNA(Asn)/glutamyl-tRNA(Gln) amidotransferase subunit A